MMILLLNREEMVSASKKLPCNHIFHTACLRSWFQRQQTCPTCRLNILRPATAAGGGADVRQPGQRLGDAPILQPAQTPVTNQDGNKTTLVYLLD